MVKVVSINPGLDAVRLPLRFQDVFLSLVVLLVASGFIAAGWALVGALVLATKVLLFGKAIRWAMAWFLLCSLFVGCGSGLKPHANLTPQPDLEPGDARTVFIGDEITFGFVQAEQATHPLWINAGALPGTDETSGQTLARFQADVIDLHPDIAHILVGTFDVASHGWPTPCGTNSGNTATCLNLQAMIQMATAANIKVIYGTIPPFGPGPLATELEVAEPGASGNADLFDRNLSLVNGFQISPWSEGTLVDYQTALFADSNWVNGVWTDNGIDPNDAGYAAMLPLTEAAIASFHIHRHL